MRGMNLKSSRPAVLAALVMGAVALLALSGIAMAKDRRGDDDGHGHHGRHHHAREPHNAGTISRFDTATGKLTIALDGGGSLTGLVTTRTEIRCEGVDDRLAQRRDHGSDDSVSGDDRGGHGSEPGDDNGGQVEPGDDHGGQGAEPGDDNGGHGAEPGDDNGGDGPMPAPGSPASCGTDSLVPGAFVGEAELRNAGGTAVFREIELGHHS